VSKGNRLIHTAKARTQRTPSGGAGRGERHLPYQAERKDNFSESSRPIKGHCRTGEGGEVPYASKKLAKSRNRANPNREKGKRKELTLDSGTFRLRKNVSNSLEEKRRQGN